MTIAGSLWQVNAQCGNFKDCGLLNIYNALYLGIIDYARHRASERVFVSQLVRIACWRLDTCAIFQQRGWTLMWRTKVVSLVTPSSQTALCRYVCVWIRETERHTGTFLNSQTKKLNSCVMCLIFKDSNPLFLKSLF